MHTFTFAFQFYKFYFMSKAKTKFYQLTPHEQREEQLSSIYKMISQQQKTMDEILTKYKGDGRQDKYQIRGRQSKTLDAKSNTNQSMSRSVQKSRSKVHSSIVDLPAISTSNNKQHVKRKKQKLPELSHIPYFSELKNKKDIQKMKEILQKAYLSDKVEKLQKSRSRKNVQKVDKKENSRVIIEKIPSPLQKEEQNNLQMQYVQNKKNEKDIPQPLGYLKSVQVEDDQVSSNQQDVPLNYYQREFKGTIRNQCLQQTNFLYFSKNQSMKDWTQNLLLLFEKHDKELALLRKRCKYLQKFDNNFFSIDIFRND